MKNARFVVIAVLISLSCAVCACFVSNNLHSRFVHRQDVIDQQFSLIKGEPFVLDSHVFYIPMFQNRVLFAYILKLVSSQGILTVSKWYLLLRFFSAFLAFLAFFCLAVKAANLNYRTVLTGMFLLNYELILAFNHGYEQAADFLDVLFISLFLYAVIKKRRLMIILAAIIAGASRESSVFAAVIWFFYHGLDNKFKPRFKEIVYAVCLGVVSYAFVLYIRLALGGSRIDCLQGVGGISHMSDVFKMFLQNPTNSSWPILFLGAITPLCVWLYLNRKYIQIRHLRLIFAAIVIEAASIQFAYIDELRTAIPFMVIMVFTAMSVESENSRPG